MDCGVSRRIMNWEVWPARAGLTTLLIEKVMFDICVEVCTMLVILIVLFYVK